MSTRLIRALALVSRCPLSAAASIPLATIHATRRTGHAIVIVERQGRPVHRYRISLRRYRALREWTLRRPWKRCSGVWLKSSGVTAYFWLN